jgi:hypothetical protein
MTYEISPRTGKPKKAPRGRAAHRYVLGSACPYCGTGTMIEKHNRSTGAPFASCSRYPVCRTAGGIDRGQDDTQHTGSNGSNHNGATATMQTDALADFAASPVTPTGAADALVTAIQVIAGQSINADQVRAIASEVVTEALEGLPEQQQHTSATVTIRVNDLPPVILDGVAHKALARAVKLANITRNGRRMFNLLMVGPAGCGKTTLAEQLCTAMGWSAERFATVSCAPGLPESALVGRVIPNLTTGATEYHAAPFVTVYRDGGVFLFDEVDNADPSTVLVLNSALANGHMTLPNGERIERHPDCVIMAAANTYGHGSDRMYVGRTQLDAAFLDRFTGAVLTLDYDRDMESKLCPDQDVCNRVWQIRDRTQSLKLRRVVSTRFLLAVHALTAGAGDSVRDAIRSCCEGWSEADLSAVGV